jgi:hypothetical protein
VRAPPMRLGAAHYGTRGYSGVLAPGLSCLNLQRRAVRAD